MGCFSFQSVGKFILLIIAVVELFVTNCQHLIYGDRALQQSSALIVGFDGEENNSNNASSSSSFAAPGCVVWDPHSPKHCCVGSGNTLRFVDTREMEVTIEKKEAHVGNIR